MPEHLTVNQGVTGSSPVGGAIKTLENNMFSRVFVISQGLKGLQKIQFLRFGGLHTRMTVNQAKYRRKDHLALTTTCLQSFAFGVFFFDSEVISLSKYEPLWRFLSGDGSGCIQFSFERIEEILGFPMDHSFLRYKQEAEQYGYRVEKISLKEKWVRFVRIAAQ